MFFCWLEHNGEVVRVYVLSRSLLISIPSFVSYCLSQMEKTEKTMAELQIDLNIRHEFDAITESGAALVPLTGPGHIGLINLGNSCYMNSVVQVGEGVIKGRRF